MKKILLLFCFISFSTILISQTMFRGRTEPVSVGTNTFVLCSATGTNCGCTASCVPAICDASNSGDCTRDPQTLILNIAADLDVAITVENQGCGSTSGLDNGDSYSVNGTVFNGSSNTTPVFDECLYTENGMSGSLIVILDANRVDECITVTVVATANGGTGGDGNPSCTNPLPVEFISFRAKPANNNATSLTWQTASEENNSHFEVEHSTNGRDFQMLNKVIGNGTTSEIQQYNYIHESAVAGTNYYRLRQVDFDGTFEYSDVVSVIIEGDSKVSVYPTLADQQVTLSFGETTREDKEVMIYNMAGLQVAAVQVAAGTDQFDIQVAELQSGFYFIQLEVNGKIEMLKFMK